MSMFDSDIRNISVADQINSLDYMFIYANKIECSNQGIPIKLDKYLELLHYAIYDLENENSVLKKKVEELYYRRGVSY